MSHQTEDAANYFLENPTDAAEGVETVENLLEVLEEESNDRDYGIRHRYVNDGFSLHEERTGTVETDLVSVVKVYHNRAGDEYLVVERRTNDDGKLTFETMDDPYRRVTDFSRD
jgi:hypothetical protein